MKEIFFSILLVFFTSSTSALADDNCSNLNLVGGGYDGTQPWGINFSAFFSPSFSGNLNATYVASSGQTATYSLPSNVTAYSANTPSIASYVWCPACGIEFQPATNFRLTDSAPFHFTKSGQNCYAEIRTIHTNSTISSNISGINVSAYISGTGSVKSYSTASTSPSLLTFLPYWDRVDLTMSPVVLNLSSGGSLVISVPSNTPDGYYEGYINLPYKIIACSGAYTCQNYPTIWSLASSLSNVSEIQAFIRIRVVDGQPVNPDTYCTTTTGLGLNIDHGVLNPSDANGHLKSNSILVSCIPSNEIIPVTVRVSSSGIPHTGPQLTGNNGVLVPLSNSMDSLVTLGVESVTQKVFNVNGVASIPVNSTLVSNNKIKAGPFSGSAIVTITYD